MNKEELEGVISRINSTSDDTAFNGAEANLVTRYNHSTNMYEAFVFVENVLVFMEDTEVRGSMEQARLSVCFLLTEKIIRFGIWHTYNTFKRIQERESL
jgi:hypothetical protein